MKYQVRILRRAQADLLEIRNYLERETKGSSRRVLDPLLDRIEALAELPLRGALPRDKHLRNAGYRFLVSGSYLVFYKVLRAQVRIYRVVHDRRAYREML